MVAAGEKEEATDWWGEDLWLLLLLLVLNDGCGDVAKVEAVVEATGEVNELA